jgi:hypothetical protein
MKFKCTANNKINTPLIGKTEPGDVVEYKEDDPRCERLLRSSFFKQIIEHNTKADKKVKEDKED